MAQTETLQDIYSKIADIYDKFCELDNNPITAIKEPVFVYDDNWTAPTITFENPDNKPEIADAEQELNELLSIATQTLESNEFENFWEYQSNDDSIQPIPKNNPIIWLPKLISILVLYRAPLKFLANLIIDFIKEIIVEDVKKRINQKRNYQYGQFSLSGTSRFKIPKNAEQMVVICSNIPPWISKRFDRKYNGENDKFLAGLGTISLGSTPEASDEIFWQNDIKIEYQKQLIDLSPLKGINYRNGYIFLENEITCEIRFWVSL